jgi:hypothetical protein
MSARWRRRRLRDGGVSVILQVGSFKLTAAHLPDGAAASHFELLGWSSRRSSPLPIMVSSPC